MPGSKTLLGLSTKFSTSFQKKEISLNQRDLKTKKAVERNIEIIGEAINRISKNKSTVIEIKNAQKIIGTRNRIVHEYDNISDELIWTIILKKLPILKKEGTEIIGKR